MKKNIIFLLVFIILFSCSNKNQFIEDLEKIMGEKEGEEQLNALVELDKKYPEKLRAKINIAAIYLGMEKTDLAELFLAKGVEAAKKSRDKDEKYIFYANYSEYLLNKGNLSESLKMGMAALENNDSDPAGASLTVAQILVSEKKYSEAVLFFKKTWETNIDLFTEQDLAAFFYLLGISQDAGNNIALMVSIIDEIRLRNPGRQGFGFQQAEILDQAGAPVASLVAVFSEIEFSRSNNVANNEIFKTIDLLYEKNKEIAANAKIIEGYKSFILEEWNIAEAVFTEITPEVSIVFYNYLKLASILQSGLGTEELFSNYLLLSRYYSGLQSYYYHLWNGMKKGSVKYDIDVEESVLKNCILISPASEYARLSRIELGRILGIPDGEKIVAVDEVFYYVDSVIKGASPNILEPVAVMLEMENNIFVEDAMELLKEAVKEKKIGEWFKNRAQKGNALIKARVSAILSN